jgi:hypothetical protein
LRLFVVVNLFERDQALPFFMDINIKTIHLHPDDNVVVCTSGLAGGETISITSKPVTLDATIGIGHKLACRDISAGEPIKKYGVVIGTAISNIPFGAHVHTHNIKSNYIPTYLIEE